MARGQLGRRPFLGQYRKALFASLGLGIAAFLFAVGLMFVSGYLVGDAAEQPLQGLFSLLVPLGFVQVFGIGKPFLSYYERLTSHDWVLRISSSLRAKLFGSVEKGGVFWGATHRIGDALGLLADDIDHIQNLYLRTVFPPCNRLGAVGARDRCLRHPLASVRSAHVRRYRRAVPDVAAHGPARQRGAPDAGQAALARAVRTHLR